MTDTEFLNQRAKEAIERDNKIYTQVPDTTHSEMMKKRDIENRIGVVRTAVNLLDQAIEDFTNKANIANSELRLDTQESFERISSHPIVKEFMRVAAQRVSIFNPHTKEHHDARWDNYDVPTVLQLVRASLIHWHKTDDAEALEHLKETLKSENLKGFKFKVDDELDHKKDDAILKEKREREARELKEQQELKKQREYNQKMDKALKLKARIDEENELLEWLEQQQKRSA